ncbi:MAG TPA: DUF2127 domain-containing protein [Dokdonella sp.]|uniref:DUF2127 domain-containing protein n=1 Tax=Dokdonella sp. TaxID=2291710 RepID=UPI002CE1BB9B|nr:DUF2127 domain-containing protein [Dokdonella sp.]HUD42445.1 DUF2127 domain-containing protein [Dokdonella sp.]
MSGRYETVARPELPAVLRGIALFKFAKAVMLALLGVALWILDDPSTLQRLAHALAPFAAGHHLLAGWFGAVPAAVGAHWHALAAAVTVYALIFLAEGIGLWRGRRWGAWLTVAVGASLIPLELYEWAGHHTALRGAVLIVNAAIMIYLWRLMHRRRRQVPAS